MMSVSKQRLRAQMGAKAVTNGWHSGDFNSPCVAFCAWWRDIQHHIPTVIKREFEQSRFALPNPALYNDPFFLRSTYIEPNHEALKQVFGRYPLTGLMPQETVNRMVKSIYDDILPILGNQLAAKGVVNQLVSHSRRGV
jgi:hypothetical protein